jgi:AcrR family transcriptional regulator
MGRRKKFENSNELILDTAELLFCQYGYERTTMEDIAKASQLGKASLYSEFPSKEDIWVAVIIRFIKTVHAQMKETAEKINLPNQPVLPIIQEMLLEQINMCYKHANQHFHGSDMVRLIEGPESHFKHKDKLFPLLLEEMKLVATLLEKAAERQEIQPQKDYFLYARMIRKAMMLPIPKDENLVEASELIGLLLNGLKHPKGFS